MNYELFIIYFLHVRHCEPLAAKQSLCKLDCFGLRPRNDETVSFRRKLFCELPLSAQSLTSIANCGCMADEKSQPR